MCGGAERDIEGNLCVCGGAKGVWMPVWLWKDEMKIVLIIFVPINAIYVKLMCHTVILKKN